MCHFLPVYHIGIAFLGRGEGQNITNIAGLTETGEYTDCVSAGWEDSLDNECPEYVTEE